MPSLITLADQGCRWCWFVEVTTTVQQFGFSHDQLSMPHGDSTESSKGLLTSIKERIYITFFGTTGWQPHSSCYPSWTTTHNNFSKSSEGWSSQQSISTSTSPSNYECFLVSSEFAHTNYGSSQTTHSMGVASVAYALTRWRSRSTAFLDVLSIICMYYYYPFRDSHGSLSTFFQYSD